MNLTTNKCISILGPTGSGKTSFSIRLAKEIDGSILSCDSVQIYKYFDVGSAKVSFSEMENIPHYLLSIVDPTKQVSVIEYQKLFLEKFKFIQKERRNPILVGGTGLYFNSLYFGHTGACKRNLDLSQKLSSFNNILLYETLKNIDPISSKKIALGDKRRLIRAVEYFLTTGEKFSNLDQKRKILPIQWKTFAIKTPRDILYQNIDKRVLEMVEKGLINEVLFLLDKYGENIPALKSIGYKETVSFLKGYTSQEEMIENIQKNTRHYAKRQLTWFRKLKDIFWISFEEYDILLKETKKFLN